MKYSDMKLENQVCTLEQAKKLKEMGVEQLSLFSHCVVMPDPTGEKYYNQILYCSEDEKIINAPIEVIACAFTVAELGVVLPKEYASLIGTMNNNYHPCKFIDGKPSEIFDLYEGAGAYGFEFEAQARAAMLIYLLDNNLTTAAEVNERLKNA